MYPALHERHLSFTLRECEQLFSRQPLNYFDAISLEFIGPQPSFVLLSDKINICCSSPLLSPS